MSSLITLPTFQGLTANGVYKGVRIQRSKPDQNGIVKETLYCGISTERQGNYGTEETIIELVISDQLIKQGIPAKLAALEGTQISLPFWERLWQGAKSVGVTRYLSQEVKDIF